MFPTKIEFASCKEYLWIQGDKNEAEATDRLGQGDADIPSDVANGLNGLDQPMTPCPSAVEYVTPVFAKNYQEKTSVSTKDF